MTISYMLSFSDISDDKLIHKLTSRALARIGNLPSVKKKKKKKFIQNDPKWFKITIFCQFKNTAGWVPR